MRTPSISSSRGISLNCRQRGRGRPGWKVRNWSDDFHGIAGAAGEVNDALMDENSLEWIDSAGVQTRECQDSQAQSIETRFAPTL